MFEYKIVADKINNKGGYGLFKAKAVTIHHSGVLTDGPYNVLERLRIYSKSHDGYFPYHFYIPRDFQDGEYNNDILITQWLNQWVVHNSNWEGNRNCLSVCLEGNFEVQIPTESQLLRLKQLLDDLASKRFQTELGFIRDFENVNPKDNKTLFTFSGIQVLGLHWHNEIAQIVNGVKQATACCGKNLIPYVKEYREKQGNVNWLTKKQEETKQDLKLLQENEELKLKILSLENALNTTKQEISKLENKKEELLNKIKNYEEMDEKTGKSLEILKDLVQEKEEKIKELIVTLEEKEKNIKNLTSQIQEQNKELNEIKSKQVQLLTLVDQFYKFLEKQKAFILSLFDKLPRVVKYNLPVILTGLIAFLSLPEYQNEILSIAGFQISVQTLVALLKGGVKEIREYQEKQGSQF